MSKTEQAIKLVESGMTQYRAAAEVGIHRATLSRAWKAHTERKKVETPGICPCCGQMLPEQKVGAGKTANTAPAGMFVR